LNMRPRPNSNPISDKQIRFAKNLGFKGPFEGLTKYQGMKIIEVYLSHKQKATT